MNFFTKLLVKFLCLFQSKTIHDLGSDTDSPIVLTRFVKSGDVALAQELSRVTRPLYGLDQSDVVESYSGFVKVNEKSNRNIFFWFFPAMEADPATAPLLIWLQGGPGSSSLYGQFELHGPYAAVSEQCGGVKAQVNPHTWARVANIIYIDNPVGAGFSFGDNLPSTTTNMTDELYLAVVQLLQLFPDLQSNRLFVFGESYGAKYALQLARKIHLENAHLALSTASLEKSYKERLRIRLTGVGLGNGYISPQHSSAYGYFMFDKGLISASQKKALLLQESEIRNSCHLDWDNCEQLSLKLLYDLQTMRGCTSYYHVDQCHLSDDDLNFKELLEYKSSRQALHVGMTPFVAFNHDVFDSVRKDIMKSELDTLEFLLEKYKVLIYNGNLDIVCNTPTVLNIFPAMTTWSGKEKFLRQEQRPLVVNNQTVGFMKSVKNLVFAGIDNAGHMVPRDQPEISLALIEKFLKGTL